MAAFRSAVPRPVRGETPSEAGCSHGGTMTPSDEAATHSQTHEATMSDRTETVRRQMVAEINVQPSVRQQLEAKHGHVWDTSELQQDFKVLGFIAPFVVARRKSDGVRGSLNLQHSPRLYFDFKVQVIEPFEFEGP
jgi:hypothetical protein